VIETACDIWFAKVIADVVLAERWRAAGRVVPAAQAALERAATKKAALAGEAFMENLGAGSRIAQASGAFITSPRGLRGAVSPGDVNGVG
jgi:hypothetical protein